MCALKHTIIFNLIQINIMNPNVSLLRFRAFITQMAMLNFCINVARGTEKGIGVPLIQKNITSSTTATNSLAQLVI